MTTKKALERFEGDINELYGNMEANHPELAKREKAESYRAFAVLKAEVAKLDRKLNGSLDSPGPTDADESPEAIAAQNELDRHYQEPISLKPGRFVRVSDADENLLKYFGHLVEDAGWSSPAGLDIIKRIKARLAAPRVSVTREWLRETALKVWQANADFMATALETSLSKVGVVVAERGKEEK